MTNKIKKHFSESILTAISKKFNGIVVVSVLLSPRYIIIIFV